MYLDRDWSWFPFTCNIFSPSRIQQKHGKGRNSGGPLTRDYGGLKAQLSCFQNDGNFFKISSLLTLFCATGHPFWRLSTVKQKHRAWSAPLLKAWHQHPLQPLEKSSSPCIEKHRAPAMGTNKDRDSWLKGFSEGRAGRNGRNRRFWRRRTFRDFPLGKKVFSFIPEISEQGRRRRLEWGFLAAFTEWFE